MTLRNIKITAEEKLFYENHFMDLGTESIIYQNNPNTIIKIWKDEVIEGLDEDKYQGMFREKGKVILKQMKNPTPAYRGEYLIDYIK